MDKYIDYFEVGEYGDHFSDEIVRLDGASPLVNVAHLKAAVDKATARVEAEFARAGLKRSDVRGGSVGLGAATASARAEVKRFFGYLASLDPKKVRFDRTLYFAGGKLGALAALKPADVLAKVSAVLNGFAAPANAELPGAAEKKALLQEVHDTLEGALRGAGAASGLSLNATAELVAAREAFLDVYNGVAKPAVRALLNELGRGREYKQFFKDLQVNEGDEPDEDDGPAPTPS